MKVKIIKDDIVFTFSYDQSKAFDEYQPEKVQVNGSIARLILKLWGYVRGKLTRPCSVSGMYFFRDFEE